MKTAPHALLLGAIALSTGLGAQIPQPQLVLDINSSSTRYSQSSLPEGMTADHNGSWRQDRFANLGSDLFLSAQVADTGRELYHATTTAGSARMVADINPGSASSNPSNFLVVGGKLYFTAEDGTNGYQIWEAVVVSGSVAVRRLTSLADTASGTAIGTMIAQRVGNADFIYFTKFDSTASSFLIHGVELPGGSVIQVSALLGQHWSQPVVLGDRIIFEGRDFRGTEAWWLDSIHSAGVLRDYNAGDGWFSDPVVIGSTLYFAAFEGSWGIYSWDRQSPVARLAAIPTDWSKPVVLGTKILFLAGVSAHAIDTAEQIPTVRALPNELAGNTAQSPYRDPVVMGNKAYFYGYSSVQPVPGDYLFEFDGATAQLIPGTRPTVFGNVWIAPEVVNDAMILFNFNSGRSLYTFDGSTISKLQIHRSTSRSANPSYITEIDGQVCFSAMDGGFGTELWISDGSQDGTVMHTNIATQLRTDSSNPRHFAAVARKLMFAADDGVHGMEPWVTDGRDLPSLYEDVWPGPSWSDPKGIRGTDEFWLFHAEDASGPGVRAAHGTVALQWPSSDVDGAEVTENAWRDSSASFHGKHVAALGADTIHGSEPNVFDPVAGEFVLGADTNPTGDGGLEDAGVDYFRDSQGRLYRVDEDGYITLAPLPRFYDTFGDVLPVREGLATDATRYLYNGDTSTSAATDAVVLPFAASYDPQTQATETFFTGSAPFDTVFWRPFLVNNGAAFIATVGTSDYLHWTDGTQANTAQINTTPIFGLESFENTLTQRQSLAVPLGQSDEMIAFPATALGIEVWRVDGTNATRVGALAFDNVEVAIPLGSHRVAFVAYESATGWEVFVTDGVQIDNISDVLAPGSLSGAEFRDAGLWAMDGKLYFNGADPRGTGNELYSWDTGALAQPYGVGTSKDLRLRAVDPVIGEMAQFSITGAPVTSTLGIVVFARPGEPFKFVGEWVYLDLATATSLPMTMAQGTGTLEFPIPNEMRLIGVRLDIQGVALPYPSLLTAGLTGAQSLTIGR